MVAVTVTATVFTACNAGDEYIVEPQQDAVYSQTRSSLSVDFTDPQGTFVVCEGNMTTVNGTVIYYDRDGVEYKDIFEQVNGGAEIGNVVQDMYIANDRLYFLTQNGNSQGGLGRLVVCDAHTMQVLGVSDLNDIQTPEGVNTWPQHLIVTNTTQAFIQYSDVNMESTSGIAEIELVDKGDAGARFVQTVDGTFGEFASAGATKARMVYSRGKLYAGCGHSVVIIDPLSPNSIEKRISFEDQQVKGVVKGADNNIYFALTGRFTGDISAPTFLSRPQMVCMDHSGNVLKKVDMPEDIQLSVASWCPAINMCASFTEPYIFFVDTDDFSYTRAARYNYNTDTFDPDYIPGDQTIYGIMGQHPTTKVLWVGKSNYITTDIYQYDVTNTATEVGHFYYGAQKYASPAGIDFAYRFTDAYINR